MSFPCSRARGLDRRSCRVTECTAQKGVRYRRPQRPGRLRGRQRPRRVCVGTATGRPPRSTFTSAQPGNPPGRRAQGLFPAPTQVVRPLHVADTPWCFNNPKRRVRPDPPLQGIQSRVRGQDGHPQHAASCRQLGLQVKTKASRCFLSALTTAGSSPFRTGASPRRGPRACCRRAWGGSTRPHQEQ